MIPTDRMRSRPSYGPIDFTPFGASGPWARRWLNSFDAIDAQPVYGIWLAHADENWRGIVVGTYVSRYFDRHFTSGHNGDPLADVARAAATNLVTLVAPDLPPPTLRDVINAAIAHADHAGAGYQSWPATSWQINGQATPARTWTFGGGWAGIATSGDFYLATAADGTVAKDITLEQVHHGQPYGIDLDQPLPEQVAPAAHQFWGRRAPLHADFAALPNRQG